MKNIFLSFFANIRPGKLTGLMFYLLVAGCSAKDERPTIEIEWRSGKATGIIVSNSVFEKIAADSMPHLLQVRLLASAAGPGILGSYETGSQAVVFRPLLPFSRGLSYEVWLRGELLDTFSIPNPGGGSGSSVVRIHPQIDTVPSNLLKFYIEFSGPMQEGQALEHLHLIRDGIDTAQDAFLNLQPELWNMGGNVLTVWFDPGRIKRDLQPNRALGPPLLPGHRYELSIDPYWRDAKGDSLSQSHSWKFFTSGADRESPDVSGWVRTNPIRNTRSAFFIKFPEPLDYMLLKNALQVYRGAQLIEGTAQIDSMQREYRFYPSSPWQPGEYALKVESRLEDLAGNNLYRLFDEETEAKRGQDPGYYMLKFAVE
jgi:hypothetical protein